MAIAEGDVRYSDILRGMQREARLMKRWASFAIVAGVAVAARLIFRRW